MVFMASLYESLVDNVFEEPLIKPEQTEPQLEHMEKPFLGHMAECQQPLRKKRRSTHNSFQWKQSLSLFYVTNLEGCVT